MVSNIFYFHPYLGKISNLTNIFQRGPNHQPVISWNGYHLSKSVVHIPDHGRSTLWFETWPTHVPAMSYSGEHRQLKLRECLCSKDGKNHGVFLCLHSSTYRHDYVKVRAPNIMMLVWTYMDCFHFLWKPHGAWDAILLHPKGAINMEAEIREIRILESPGVARVSIT